MGRAQGRTVAADAFADVFGTRRGAPRSRYHEAYEDHDYSREKHWWPFGADDDEDESERCCRLLLWMIKQEEATDGAFTVLPDTDAMRREISVLYMNGICDNIPPDQEEVWGLLDPKEWYQVHAEIFLGKPSRRKVWSRRLKA